MNIVITGATGFIGRNLIEKLLPLGHEITAVYNERTPPNIPEVKWIKADLRSSVPENLFRNCETVYMCAAVSSGANDIINRPHIFVTENTLINQNTIVSAVSARVRHIIFPSCSVMYGDSKNIQDEQDVSLYGIFPKYLGGASMKLYVEQLCKFYSTISDTKFTVIRHTNTYGPHDKFDPARAHVFAATIVKTAGNPKTINIWGSGEEGRDFIYIDDLMDLMLRCPNLQETNFELICAGSEKLVSINELVDEICNVRGISPIITRDLSAPTLPINICLSHQRAKSTFGWHPKTSLRAGIELTLAWRQE